MHYLQVSETNSGRSLAPPVAPTRLVRHAIAKEQHSTQFFSLKISQNRILMPS